MRRRGAASVALVIAVVSSPEPRTALADAPRPAAPRTIVDPALVPAGGCRGCNAPSCRTCQVRHGGHHPVCRDGKCHPHCPVRPLEFGFYGTQWRRWPDRQVVPVAHDREDTPASPPRSQIPRGDEESRRATDDAAAPESGQPAEDAANDPENGPEDAPAPRRPQPPQADEDPAALPPKASGGLQPRLLPQAVQGNEAPHGDEAPEPDRPHPPADQRRPAAARRIAAAQRPDVPGHEAQSAAPEPTAIRAVVTAAGQADDGIDESSLGPARRRFIARRPAVAGAGTEPAPAAVPRGG